MFAFFCFTERIDLVVLQHPVQPRGVPGGELHQGEEVRAHDAAHAGRGGQDLHRQHHLPAVRSPPTLRSPITPSLPPIGLLGSGNVSSFPN
jgi:hypothetical protein